MKKILALQIELQQLVWSEKIEMLDVARIWNFFQELAVDETKLEQFLGQGDPDDFSDITGEWLDVPLVLLSHQEELCERVKARTQTKEQKEQ